MTDPVLGEREQAAVREALAAIERDVEVTLELGPTATPVTLLAAGGREIDPNAVALDLVEAVCALGPGEGGAGIHLTVVEREEPGPWPRTTVAPGVSYLGMPVGYELTTLVHAVAEAGRATPSLGAAALERLEGLDRDIAVDVFVTPT